MKHRTAAPRPSWVVPGIGFLVVALLFVLLLVLVNAMRG